MLSRSQVTCALKQQYGVLKKFETLGLVKKQRPAVD